MKLVEDLIADKMLVLYEEFSLRKFEIRAVWMFYKCFNISASVLGIEDKRERIKAKIWKNLVSAVVNQNNYLIKKYENQMIIEINRDLIIITDALSILAEENQKAGFDKSTLWKRGVVGIPDYEVEGRKWNH